MPNLGKVLGRLGSKAVKKMDDAAKRFAGLPGYDDDTVEAIIELKKKEKTKAGLTSAEEKELDRLMSKQVRESGAEDVESMPKSQKSQKLTPKQMKEEQERLNMAKGGAVKKKTKMSYGGMAKVKMAKGGYANCGASVKPAQKAKK